MRRIFRRGVYLRTNDHRAARARKTKAVSMRDRGFTTRGSNSAQNRHGTKVHM